MKTARPTLLERVKRYYSCGPYAGLVVMFVIIIDIFIFAILCLIWPAHTIDKALDFPHKEYRENKEKYGEHNFSILPKKK